MIIDDPLIARDVMYNRFKEASRSNVLRISEIANFLGDRKTATMAATRIAAICFNERR